MIAPDWIIVLRRTIPSGVRCRTRTAGGLTEREAALALLVREARSQEAPTIIVLLDAKSSLGRVTIGLLDGPASADGIKRISSSPSLTDVSRFARLAVSRDGTRRLGRIAGRFENVKSSLLVLDAELELSDIASMGVFVCCNAEPTLCNVLRRFELDSGSEGRGDEDGGRACNVIGVGGDEVRSMISGATVLIGRGMGLLGSGVLADAGGFLVAWAFEGVETVGDFAGRATVEGGCGGRSGSLGALLR